MTARPSRPTGDPFVCRECRRRAETLYGRPGREVCLRCYDDLEHWPDMGRGADSDAEFQPRPKGGYA